MEKTVRKEGKRAEGRATNDPCPGERVRPAVPDTVTLLLFARLFEYPSPEIPGIAGELLKLLARTDPSAATKFAEFEAFVRKTPLPELEELYTHTFDLHVVCHPYVGYQLFGDSYKRGALLAALRERYVRHGFREGGELPDHVSVVLRFLAACTEEETAVPIVEEALVPALVKMTDSLENGSNPYASLIEALLSHLGGARRQERSRPAAERRED